MSNSQLEAFRYPLDNQTALDSSNYRWRAVFSDRYAFFMPVFERLESIEVYDLENGVARFVDWN